MLSLCRHTLATRSILLSRATLPCTLTTTTTESLSRTLSPSVRTSSTSISTMPGKIRRPSQRGVVNGNDGAPAGLSIAAVKVNGAKTAASTLARSAPTLALPVTDDGCTDVVDPGPSIDTKPAPPPPAAKKGRKSKAEKEAEEVAAIAATSTATANGDAATKPSKGRSGSGGVKRKSAAGTANKPSVVNDENKDITKGNGSASTTTTVEDQPELDSDGEPVRRAKNGRKLPKKKAKKEKVYIIPDVEKRDFRDEFRPGSTDIFSSREARKGGFTGRLGYACLNTVLRAADPPVFSSRTARIKSIDEKGLDWVKELAKQNAKDIIPMLRWNAEHNIRFMRLSSEIFPFASHKIYGYSCDCAAEELAEAGRVARELNHRVTMHPGQFVQLGSPNPEVVEASIRELSVHAEVLDLMGMDQDSVMIIHGGGVYGDRGTTLNRMRETIANKLPTNVRNRIVLENDEIMWSAEELLPVCHEFKIPMVFDFHHDMLRPSKKSPAELMPELLSLFGQRGIKPKFHLSHPRPGSRNLRERRAHSDRCGWLPLDLPPDADLMIEAKGKEQAVLELYRIYDLYPVAHEILRPPADDGVQSLPGKRKVLNGSGGAAPATMPDEDDEGGGEVSDDGDQESKSSAKKSKSASSAAAASAGRETEASKIQRSIEHSKRIAAKRGVPYKGPEYASSPLEARLRQGPILSIAQTYSVMEAEADLIRSQLKESEAQGRPRALSEIRDDVEGNVKVEGIEGSGMGNGRSSRSPSPAPSVPGGKPVRKGKAKGKDSAASDASDAEGGYETGKVLINPSQSTAPGIEEEGVTYQPVTVSVAPVTPVKGASVRGRGRGRGRGGASNRGSKSGQAGPAETVVIPTSAENVDRVL